MWKDGFLFLGNNLALDFLNTRPAQNGETIELLPDFSALLRWFQATGLINSREAANLYKKWGSSVRARRTHEVMLVLREALRKDILRWSRGGTARHSMLDELNRLMAQHPMRTRIKQEGGAVSTEQYLEPSSPEDLFSPLAQSAVMLFANANRQRVRQCDHCVLLFLDTSKKGTRRWCSMQLCGNRLKVATYAARRRSRKASHRNRL